MQRKTFLPFYYFSFCLLVMSTVSLLQYYLFLSSRFIYMDVSDLLSIPDGYLIHPVCIRAELRSNWISWIIFHWPWTCDRPDLPYIFELRLKTLDQSNERKFHGFWIRIILFDLILSKNKIKTRRYLKV